MSDLLSSASLLIAIVTVLYALWYPEIRRGIKEIKATGVREDDKISEVLGIIIWRALPLMAASLGLAVVFLKDAIVIVQRSWRDTADLRSRITTYDTVATAFVLVEIVCIFLAILTVVQSAKLAINWRTLRSKPKVV
jgi:hypothetical protein